MKNFIIGISLLASFSTMASHKVICGEDESEINQELERLKVIEVSVPSIAIAQTSQAAYQSGLMKYDPTVDTTILICVTVKY